ncbi:MAG: SIMPL domain-containing protein [Burkholderiales bacterium]
MMRFVLSLLLPLFLAAGAHASGTDLSNTRVQLDARASAEVENDVMRAVLYAEMEDLDSAKLADRLNRTVNQAIATLKEHAGLQVRSGAYNTWPVTEKSRIVRWRARAEVIIEGKDFRQVSDAIGSQQNRMQLSGVSFSVSDARRAATEAELTDTAIADFLRKADLIARGFQGKRFHVAEAKVSSDGGSMPPPRPVMMRSMVADEAVAAPAFEGGTSRVTVTVSGAILIPR